MHARSYQLLHASVAAGSMAAWIRRYLEALAVQQLRPQTVKAQQNTLGVFYAWCEERGIATPLEVHQAMLERYQKHVFYVRKGNGEPLSVARQHQLLGHVRLLFRWLTKHGHLPADPASGLELPRSAKRLLPDPLTIEEVERVLGVLNLANPHELRDRALLEVLYSTGIRRAEACGLSIYDIDAGRGTLFVRQGKGRRDRVVPIGARALWWVAKYQDEVRPHLAFDPKQTALFLNLYGAPLGVVSMSKRVTGYAASR